MLCYILSEGPGFDPGFDPNGKGKLVNVSKEKKNYHWLMIIFLLAPEIPLRFIFLNEIRKQLSRK